MSFIELISSAHPYLDVFDYNHYPSNFAEFEDRCAEWFEQYRTLNEKDTVECILEQFEQRWKQIPRRDRKETAFRDKQILALFFSPAAEHASGIEKEFAEALRSQWNARFPKNSFLPGHFEDILKGFDANLLGLPLRKSKKTR